MVICLSILKDQIQQLKKKYNDDVKEEIKQKRLVEIINLQQAQSLENNKKRLNKTYEVLIEGYSKRSKNHYSGRTTHNCVVVFEKGKQKIGNYVNVKIYDCTAGTLKGKII
jgi:tRNA-2-methylthio-N6-dimethylallyladenosine synthase